MYLKFSENVLLLFYTVLWGTMRRMKYLSCDSYVTVRACPTSSAAVLHFRPTTQSTWFKRVTYCPGLIAVNMTIVYFIVDSATRHLPRLSKANWGGRWWCCEGRWNDVNASRGLSSVAEMESEAFRKSLQIFLSKWTCNCMYVCACVHRVICTSSAILPLPCMCVCEYFFLIFL